MGLTKTKKALNSLKQRIFNAKNNLKFVKENTPQETYEETFRCIEEIQTLIEAYEKQIELNKKQNYKICCQRGILKAMYQKQGDANGKTNI